MLYALLLLESHDALVKSSQIKLSRATNYRACENLVDADGAVLNIDNETVLCVTRDSNNPERQHDDTAASWQRRLGQCEERRANVIETLRIYETKHSENMMRYNASMNTSLPLPQEPIGHDLDPATWAKEAFENTVVHTVRFACFSECMLTASSL